MERPTPPARPAFLNLTRPDDPDPRIEDYLDHITAPLVGRVDHARRREVREEILDHLSALIEARRFLGEDEETAVREALRQFGDPCRLSREIRRSLLGSRPESLGASFPSGLAYFGGLTALILLVIVAIGCVGPMWRPPLSLGLLPPFVAGFLTGWRGRGRAPIGVFLAMAACIAATALLGFPLSNAIAEQVAYSLSVGDIRNEIVWQVFGFPEDMASPFIDLLIQQIATWLPFGCLGAWIGERFRDAAETPPRPVAG